MISLLKQWKTQLEKLSNPTQDEYCLVCFEKIKRNTITLFFKRNILLCNQCFIKMKSDIKKFELDGVTGIGIYPYESFVRKLLFQFKGCKDIALKDVFFIYYARLIKQRYKDYYIVPIPSYIEHDQERGFNHVEKMCEILSLPMIKCLRKNTPLKQSSLHFNKRNEVYKNYSLNELESLIENKKILLVDDVLTTSNTMKACLNLIKKQNPLDLKFLVMSYSSRKMSNFDY